MSETKSPRSRRTAANDSKPKAVESTPSPKPVMDEKTIQAALDWLNTVDSWSIAGHQNLFPRWVYAVALLFLLT